MARIYDVLFSNGDHHVVVRGEGNTRRSAEVSARRKLRREVESPEKFTRVSTTFVKGA